MNTNKETLQDDRRSASELRSATNDLESYAAAQRTPFRGELMAIVNLAIKRQEEGADGISLDELRAAFVRTSEARFSRFLATGDGGKRRGRLAELLASFNQRPDASTRLEWLRVSPRGN